VVSEHEDKTNNSCYHNCHYSHNCSCCYIIQIVKVILLCRASPNFALVKTVRYGLLRFMVYPLKQKSSTFSHVHSVQAHWINDINLIVKIKTVQRN